LRKEFALKTGKSFYMPQKPSLPSQTTYIYLSLTCISFE